MSEVLSKQYNKTVQLTVNPLNSQAAVVTLQVDAENNQTVNLTQITAALDAGTSVDTPSTIVKRDANGDFAAHTITASLNGLANTATNFAGSLTGDVTGTQSATVVATVGTSTASNVHSAELAANAATDANTASKIVKRDASGNFTAGTITAALTGNASTASSATKWTTARNLAGNSVDGSANVAFANKFIVQGTSDSGLSAAQFTGALGTGIVKNTTTTGILSIAVAGDFPTLNQDTSGTSASVTGTNVIANANLAQMAAHTFKGNNTGSTANALDLTKTQLTAELNQFSSSLQGVVPSSGGGSSNFLRADGSWSTPSGTLASPLTTKGDIWGHTSADAAIPVGSDNQVLTADSTQTLGVKWGSYTAPTVTQKLTTGTTVGYIFVTAGSATVGATYTNNSNTYTVAATNNASLAYIYFTGTSAPQTSGTLTKSAGTGDATLTFTSAQTYATYTVPTSPKNPLYLKVHVLGGGGGGGGGGTGSPGTGTNGNGSYFGYAFAQAKGGFGGTGAAGSSTPPAGGLVTVLSSGTVPMISMQGTGGGVSAGGGPAGGFGVFGGGAQGGTNSGTSAIANSGSGGAGGSTTGSTANGGYGGGAGGYAHFIIASPTGTYPYSVGAQGTGGGGGTNGHTAGDGGSGLVLIEEYYQ